jgi:hypothetical protein
VGGALVAGFVLHREGISVHLVLDQGLRVTCSRCLVFRVSLLELGLVMFWMGDGN